MDNRPIGMFDSGVGGMTVFKEIKRQIPNEKIIYLGDTRNFPYGEKSKDVIIELTKKNLKFLYSKNVKAIIIACGTATSQALETIEKEKLYSEIPIIGIIQPTVEYILKKEKNLKKIGIIATEGTIKSNSWENQINNKIKDVEIISKACPLLAPMAEEGWVDNEIAKLAIKEYIKDLKNIDSLILGCTHYPLFKKIIQDELGKNIEVINTGENLATYLKDMLINKKIEASNNKKEQEIYLTDIECNFINVANRLLEEEIKDIKKIDI